MNRIAIMTEIATIARELDRIGRYEEADALTNVLQRVGGSIQSLQDNSAPRDPNPAKISYPQNPGAHTWYEQNNISPEAFAGRIRDWGYLNGDINVQQHLLQNGIPQYVIDDAASRQ